MTMYRVCKLVASGEMSDVLVDIMFTITITSMRFKSLVLYNKTK